MTARVEVDEAILQFALRYALGRQTFAPTDVQQAVRENLDRLSTRFIRVAIDDIDGAERLSDLGLAALGNDRIDAPGWLELRDQLRERALY